MLKKYQTKPIYGTAIQYTGTNYTEIVAFIQAYYPENEHNIHVQPIIDATTDQLMKRKKAGAKFTSLDRFVKIWTDNDTYELFDGDYILINDRDGILIYDEHRFNDIWQEVK